jgi:hypothetical protein
LSVFAQHIYIYISFETKVQSLTFIDVVVVASLITRCSSEELNLLAIWVRHNVVVHRESSLTPTRLSKKQVQHSFNFFKFLEEERT